MTTGETTGPSVSLDSTPLKLITPRPPSQRGRDHAPGIVADRTDDVGGIEAEVTPMSIDIDSTLYPQLHSPRPICTQRRSWVARSCIFHPRYRWEHECRFGIERDNRRFIPAPAGNTPAPTSTTALSPVHPRSRGEHEWWPANPAVESGSSPLPRGTPRQHRRGPGR